MTREEITEKIAALEKEKDSVKGSECEVYTRIVGYHRPVKNWNDAKQEEFKNRIMFD